MTTAAISAETWELVGTLFDQLAALPPEQRNLHTLDQPRSVRTLLEQMLVAHDTADPQLLDRTVRAVVGGLLQGTVDTPAPGEDYQGRLFGPWRAREEIGRGGMAVVLRGERADGRFEKEVAIKLLPHTGAGLERERLLEEIRILARLEHPNIARLIDGGIGDDGTPYLVMEYVHGVPINKYCERHELDIRARVQLFMQVVDAARFAHRHLVVHCDIKPGNILVTDEGQAKLVDFGIAGLQSGGAAAETMPRGLFCSPAYCAPEQIRGGPPDTAQDIFSLGAVLYELLCGRRIRDNKAATRLLFGADAADVLPPSRHKPGVTRDLDAICGKALATEAGDRYAGANALLMDLKRWLAGEPVAARVGGAPYRMGKWLRRHWLPAAAACVTVLALIIGAGAALWQAQQARTAQHAAELELERSTALNQFILNLFEGARLGMPRDQVPTTRELLLRGVEQVREGFEGQAELQGDLLTLTGDLLASVGLAGEAREVLAEAVSTREQLYDAMDPRLGEARLRYGEALHYTEHVDQAIEQLRMAVAALQDAGKPELLARAMHALGYALSERLESEPALEAHFEALAIQRGHQDLEALGQGLSSTARTLQRAGRLEEAKSMYQEALQHLRATLGERHYAVGTVLSDYGVTLRRLAEYEPAEQVLRESIEIGEAVYTGPHVTLAQRWNNLGSVLAARGNRPAAIEAFGNSMQVLDALQGDDTRRVLAGPLNNLGFLSMTIGEYEEAEAYLRRSLALLETAAGRDHPGHIAVSRNLGRSLLLQGNYEEAEAVLEDVLERANSHYPEHDERITGILSALGKLRWERDRDPEGLAMIRRAFDVTRAHNGDDHDDTARRALELADALAMVPDPEAARPLFEMALRTSENQFPPLHHQVLAARAGLAETLLQQGELGAARETLDPIGTLPPMELAETDPLRSRLAALGRQLAAARSL